MTWKKNENLDDSGIIYHWEALAKAMQNMTIKGIMQKNHPETQLLYTTISLLFVEKLSFELKILSRNTEVL